MSAANQPVVLANLGTSFALDNVAKKVDVDAATVDVAAATDITATTLIAALSEIGSRLAALEL